MSFPLSLPSHSLTHTHTHSDTNTCEDTLANAQTKVNQLQSQVQSLGSQIQSLTREKNVSSYNYIITHECGYSLKRAQ